MPASKALHDVDPAAADHSDSDSTLSDLTETDSRDVSRGSSVNWNDDAQSIQGSDCPYQPSRTPSDNDSDSEVSEQPTPKRKSPRGKGRAPEDKSPKTSRAAANAKRRPSTPSDESDADGSASDHHAGVEAEITLGNTQASAVASGNNPDETDTTVNLLLLKRGCAYMLERHMSIVLEAAKGIFIVDHLVCFLPPDSPGAPTDLQELARADTSGDVESFYTRLARWKRVFALPSSWYLAMQKYIEVMAYSFDFHPFKYWALASLIDDIRSIEDEYKWESILVYIFHLVDIRTRFFFNRIVPWCWKDPHGKDVVPIQKLLGDAECKTLPALNAPQPGTRSEDPKHTRVCAKFHNRQGHRAINRAECKKNMIERERAEARKGAAV